MEEIIIGSWNIHNIPLTNSRNRNQKIYQVVHGLDIICLQEDFFYSNDLKEVFKDYHIFYENKNIFKLNSGLTTLVKKNLKVVSSKIYYFKECSGIIADDFDCWATKGFQVTYVKNDKEFIIVNLHLNAGSQHLDDDTNRNQTIRNKQLQEIKSFIKTIHKDIPIVMIGDFNMKLTNSSFKKFVPNDFIISTKYCNCKEGNCPEFTYFDHLITRNLKSPNVYCHTNIKLSDHSLLTTTIKI